MKKCALAIFVKTPGLSPIKTRLAESVGTENAARFYELSCQATASVVKQATLNNPMIIPYWAVAEAEGLGHRQWSSFKQILQGEGPLGRRLSNIYRVLRACSGHVILIGADMPQMQTSVIEQTVKMLANSFQGKSAETGRHVVIGPSADGGFYLFGSNLDLPSSFWDGISYGTEHAYSEILERAKFQADVHLLPCSFDVDTGEDLKELHRALVEQSDLTPAQVEILRWLEGSNLR